MDEQKHTILLNEHGEQASMYEVVDWWLQYYDGLEHMTEGGDTRPETWFTVNTILRRCFEQLTEQKVMDEQVISVLPDKWGTIRLDSKLAARFEGPCQVIIRREQDQKPTDHADLRHEDSYTGEKPSEQADKKEDGE